MEEPGVPIERSSDVLYHVDVDKSGDELDFVPWKSTRSI